MNLDERTASDLGEEALIERVVQRIGPPEVGETWSGDDAAVVDSPAPRLIYTLDVLVEGVDFDLSYCFGSDVGWKAMASSASDVAAMGGRPSYALAGLALPPTTLTSVVDGIADGLTGASRRWGIRLVGGDVSRAGEISLSVAMLGAPGGRRILRSGARQGEAICVTGCLGGAAGGLIALRRGLAGPGLTEGRSLSPGLAQAVERLAVRQLRPEARVDEAARLARMPVSAMIDVSDGLAVDLDRLLRASGAGCDVNPEAIPVDPDLRPLQEAVSDERIEPPALALTGGEDFELLFTIAPGEVEAARASLEELGTSLRRIGTVVDGDRRIGDHDLEHWKEKGWDHLLAR